MADPNMELLTDAIKATQELRASVSQVFGKLGNGLKDSNDPIGKEKAYLSELQQSLLSVNKDLNDLEKLSSSISGSSLNFGNSSMLTLDPTGDKPALYCQLTQAYKWANKMHDHVNLSTTLLGQNNLKRSQTSGGLSAKRPRKTLTTSHAVPSQIVDALVQNLDRLFPDMSISLTRPMGSPAVLQITLGKTLQAVVVLRGLIIEWVSVKGYDEPTHLENGKLDVWAKSKYAVFQKVTDHTSAAMLHFYSPLIPELAVKSFMTWFHSYISLFSKPCHKCGHFLQDNLPPTWRDFRVLDAYHEHCRP